MKRLAILVTIMIVVPLSWAEAKPQNLLEKAIRDAQQDHLIRKAAFTSYRAAASEDVFVVSLEAEKTEDRQAEVSDDLLKEQFLDAIDN